MADFQRLLESGYWTAYQSLTVGLDTLLESRRFQVFKGGVSRGFDLGGDRFLRARASGQWSSARALPSTEQLQLGGAFTVRGHEEGRLLGDEGYQLGVELGRRFRGDDLAGLLPSGLAEAVLFVDHGRVFGLSGAPLESQSLSAVGIGLNLQVQGFGARLGFGVALGAGGGDTARVHALLQYAIE